VESIIITIIIIIVATLCAVDFNFSNMAGTLTPQNGICFSFFAYWNQ